VAGGRLSDRLAQAWDSLAKAAGRGGTTAESRTAEASSGDRPETEQVSVAARLDAAHERLKGAIPPPPDDDAPAEDHDVSESDHDAPAPDEGPAPAH